jgi:hypothetical protein
MQFFSSKHVSRPPDSYPKAVSNINSNSPRYLNSKLIPRCGPPGGFDPMVWNLPQNRILQCGPLCGIESYSVAPPSGSNPTVCPSRRTTLLGLERDRDIGRDRDWDRDRDRTFRCGSSRGIRLSAVAPPAGSDFPLWPLPGDRTFRCSPSRRIESYGVALPTGSTATPRDRLNIL